MGRRPKNHRPDLNGLMIVDKPLGLTSMDVLRQLRRVSGGAKLGHAGTLDPLASGVLVCCFGTATKAVAGLMDGAKRYQTTVDLAAFTVTDDAEGPREPVDVATPPEPEAVRAALDALTGIIKQRPPAYSACKIDGQPAYKRVRSGEEVVLAEREVRIDQITIERYQWPTVELSIDCGKGVYIRSLARQLGEALGTGGHLTALRRTKVGPYTIEQSLALDAVSGPIEPEHLLPV